MKAHLHDTKATYRRKADRFDLSEVFWKSLVITSSPCFLATNLWRLGC